MRISDWSSDVYSSDLRKSFKKMSRKSGAPLALMPRRNKEKVGKAAERREIRTGARTEAFTVHLLFPSSRTCFGIHGHSPRKIGRCRDRKSTRLNSSH